MKAWIAGADRLSPWPQATVVVAGLGTSGFAAADGLLDLGAQVLVRDESESPANLEKATVLEMLDAEVRLGPGATDELPADVDLVVTSPGWRPSALLLARAARIGVPVWGEVELAWRMSLPDRQVPWLAVTGTNGKTTTVRNARVDAHGHAGCTIPWSATSTIRSSRRCWTVRLRTSSPSSSPASSCTGRAASRCTPRRC